MEPGLFKMCGFNRMLKNPCSMLLPEAAGDEESCKPFNCRARFLALLGMTQVRSFLQRPPEPVIKAKDLPARRLTTVERPVLCKRAGQILWVACCVFLSSSLARAQGHDNVPELMQQAITAQKNGETSTAIHFYRKVLELRPEWGPAEYNLGLVISVEKNYAEAVDLFNAALKHDPSLTGAYLFRGIAYYNLGDFHHALTSLGVFAKWQPADSNVHYYLAGCYSALGDYSDAAVEYIKQMRITPGREDLFYYLGRCYLAMAHQMVLTLSNTAAGNYYMALIFGEEGAQEGRSAAAEQNIRRAIKQNPQRTEAYVEFGELLLRNGEIAAAKVQFGKALELKPADCSALEGLGDAELAAGNLSRALTVYSKAQKLIPACIQRPPPEYLGLAPEEFESRLRSLKAQTAQAGRRSEISLELARLEYSSSKSAEARLGSDSDGSNTAAGSRECQVAAQARGLRFQAQRNIFLASCDQLHGDFAGATLALISANRSNTADPARLYSELRVLMSLSRAVLDDLAAKAPNSYLISEMRAEWLELRGEDTEADSAYKAAARSSGDNPDVLIEYATFECKRNRLDEAVPILLKAVHQVPYNAGANSLLGYVYFTKNQFGQAVPYLSKAIQGNPSDEQSRIYLGESLRNLHQVREAVTILKDAPSDPDGRIHYVLASCYRALGQKEEMQRAMAFFGERQKKVHTRQISAH